MLTAAGQEETACLQLQDRRKQHAYSCRSVGNSMLTYSCRSGGNSTLVAAG